MGKYDKHFEQHHEKYEKHYDEGKFEKMVKKLPRKVSEPFVRLYYVMKHPEIDNSSKVLCIAALGYVVLSFDLMPDIIPIIGWIDDVVIVMSLLKKLKNRAYSDWVNKKITKFYQEKKLSISG